MVNRRAKNKMSTLHAPLRRLSGFQATIDTGITQLGTILAILKQLSSPQATIDTGVKQLPVLWRLQLSTLDDLCKLTRDLKDACNPQKSAKKHLQEFYPRIVVFKNEIFQCSRDSEVFVRLQTNMNKFLDYYNDQERWIHQHGSLDGWTEYVARIGYVNVNKVQSDIWVSCMHAVVELDTLWKEVQMADAKERNKIFVEQRLSRPRRSEYRA
jgi:hypothetical protein